MMPSVEVADAMLDDVVVVLSVVTPAPNDVLEVDWIFEFGAEDEVCEAVVLP